MIVCLSIPIRTVGQPPRGHWSKASNMAASQKKTVMLSWMYAAAQGRFAGTVGLPKEIVLRRVSPGSLDSDNLPYAMKHVRDEVTMRLGRSQHTGRGDEELVWRYEQRKPDSTERKYKHLVEVELHY